MSHLYVLLILIKQDQVLLLQRTSSAAFGPNHFSLIGGKVEAGESFTQAIIREAYEEVGIVVEAAHLAYAGTMFAHLREGDGVCVNFVARSWQHEPYNREPDKHVSVGWYSLDSLPEPMLPLNRFAIEQLNSPVLYHEFDYRNYDYSKL